MQPKLLALIALARRPRYPAGNKRKKGEGEKKKKCSQLQKKKKKLSKVIFCADGSCDAPIREDKATAAIVERRKSWRTPH